MPPTNLPAQLPTHTEGSSVNTSTTITRNGITITVSMQVKGGHHHHISDRCQRAMNAMIDDLVAFQASLAQDIEAVEAQQREHVMTLARMLAQMNERTE